MMTLWSCNGGAGITTIGLMTPAGIGVGMITRCAMTADETSIIPANAAVHTDLANWRIGAWHSLLEQTERFLFIAGRNLIASILRGVDCEYLLARNRKARQRIAGGLPDVAC